MSYVHLSCNIRIKKIVPTEEKLCKTINFNVSKDRCGYKHNVTTSVLVLDVLVKQDKVIDFKQK